MTSSRRWSWQVEEAPSKDEIRIRKSQFGTHLNHCFEIQKIAMSTRITRDTISNWLVEEGTKIIEMPQAFVYIRMTEAYLTERRRGEIEFKHYLLQQIGF